MNLLNEWKAYALGIALLVLGLAMVWSHHRRWNRETFDDAEDDFERRHRARRHRRRMQTSGLIAALGLMIAASPLAIPAPANAPLLFGAWWLIALLLALWIIALAFGDILATRAHSHLALARLRIRQQELEHKLAELRKHQGNGRQERTGSQG